MTANTITGAELLTQLSDLIGDYWVSSTTADGNAGGTTLEDSALTRYETDAIRGWYIRITQSGGNQYEVRRIKTLVGGVVTVSPAFSGQVSSGDTYELHAYDPARKFANLDRARLYAFNDGVSQVIYDETTTADGENNVYDLPSSLRHGPYTVWQELPVTSDTSWNWLNSPEGDSTDNWTASSLTASTVSEQEYDNLVPKYDSDCTKLVIANATAGTYTQTVANMQNSVTAATPAGRRMTFAVWVYSRVASRVTIRIADDAGNQDSAAHQGLGWELLTVTKDIDGDNATTLAVSIRVSSGDPLTVFWNRAWFFYGERLPEFYLTEIPIHGIQRDGSVQRVHLGWVPEEGYQLRFVGRGLLSALGTTVSSQPTNTMELDDQAAEALVTQAAQLLFTELGISSESTAVLAAKIAAVSSRNEAMNNGAFTYRVPDGPRVRNPWS